MYMLAIVKFPIIYDFTYIFDISVILVYIIFEHHLLFFFFFCTLLSRHNPLNFHILYDDIKENTPSSENSPYFLEQAASNVVDQWIVHHTFCLLFFWLYSYVYKLQFVDMTIISCWYFSSY